MAGYKWSDKVLKVSILLLFNNSVKKSRVSHIVLEGSRGSKIVLKVSIVSQIVLEGSRRSQIDL